MCLFRFLEFVCLYTLFDCALLCDGCASSCGCLVFFLRVFVVFLCFACCPCVLWFAYLGLFCVLLVLFLCVDD